MFDKRRAGCHRKTSIEKIAHSSILHDYYALILIKSSHLQKNEKSTLYNSMHLEIATIKEHRSTSPSMEDRSCNPQGLWRF